MEIVLNNIYQRGVRGAITVDENNQEELKKATVELLGAMLEENKIETKDIAFAIFTITNDINCDFPAKFARLYCGFSKVPMMCYNEADIKGSIEKCLRILLVVNTSKTQDEIKHIYLKEARKLRLDLS